MGRRIGRGVIGRVAGEPSELARAIHADEDLAEEALPTRRFAAGTERLDGDLGHGASGLGRGEGPALEPFRGREQPPAMDDIRVAGATGHRVERLVAAGPGAGWHPRAGRQQFHDPEAVAVGVADQGGDQPVAGPHPAEGRGRDRLRPAVHELHGPAVACHGRRHGLQGPPDGRALPAPRSAQGRSGERIDREERGGLAAEDPRRRVVRGAQTGQIRAGRWLTQHEPDPRRRGAATVVAVLRVGVGGERPEPGWAGQADEGGRGPLPEAPQVLAQPGIDRAVGATVQALHEAAHEADGILERDPRIAFAPLLGGRQLHVTVRHVQVPGPTRRRGEAAGRQDRMQEREPEGGEDRRGAQVGLDAIDDGGEAHQLARRVQVEQLVDQGRRPVHGREPGLDDRPDLVGPDVRSEADQVLGIEWRLADLGLAPLVTADRAAVHAGDRLGLRFRGGPDELLGDQHPAAGGAARRIQVAQRDLEARLASRGRGHALECGVEVADVGRSQDDFGQHPRQRILPGQPRERVD